MHVLLPYQSAWVENDHKYSIYEKSRQIGITLAEAFWSVRTRRQRKQDHWFVSANEDTAAEFIRYCKMWVQVFNTKTGCNLVDLSKSTTEQIVFPNGSRITSLSSNPTRLRGQHGSVTLDEFAFTHTFSDEELYIAAQPCITWGGNLRIISTHNGTGTVFNKIINDISSGQNQTIKHYKTTLLDAIEQGLAEKVPGDHQKLLPDIRACRNKFVQNIKDGCLSDTHFKQEYLCEVADATSLISAEDYHLCIMAGNENPPAELDHKQKYGPLFIGFDIGRTQDSSIIWAAERGIDPKAPPNQKECYRTVAIKRMQNMPFKAQLEVANRFLSHPSVSRAAIDRGGIGMSISEELHDKFHNRIEEVNISLNLKAELCERVAKMVAQQRVTLPTDRIIQEDIMAMRRTLTAGGRPTYDGHTKDTHCDYFMALALMLHAADNVVVFNWHNKTPELPAPKASEMKF